MSRLPICAVIVTYGPPSSLSARVTMLAATASRVILVDNGSASEDIGSLREISLAANVELIENETNLGVARALNIGLARAKTAGFAWALTLDQDSEPSHTMLDSLWRTATSRGRAAIVAPAIRSAGFPDRQQYWLRSRINLPWMFQRVPCSQGELSVTVAITSGSLVNLEVWETLGRFEDDLFIDYVDTEYCLRAIRAGYPIIVNCEAELWHNLGSRSEQRLLGKSFFPTNHSPLRHYYMARNRVLVIRRHGLRVPHWLIFDIVSAIYVLVRIILVESAKRRKLRAIVMGTLDGIRGKRGSIEVRDAVNV